MAWLLLCLGASAGIGGVLSLGNARLAIDKIESLLLFLIAAVLITGGSVVRAVNRSRVVLELEDAIRGRIVPPQALESRRARHQGGEPGTPPTADDAQPRSPGVAGGKALWDDEDEPVRRPGRIAPVLSTAFLGVTVGLPGL